MGDTMTDPTRDGRIVRVGVVGAGQISGAYLRTIPGLANLRVTAIADLARALTGGGPHRADGRLAYHVLDVMESLLCAARNGDSAPRRRHLRPIGQDHA